jgi:hypothetical protein
MALWSKAYRGGFVFILASTSSYNNILATQPRKQNKEAGSGSQ